MGVMEKDALFIGNMDRRIQVIEKITTKSEDTGAEILTNNLLAEVWAERKTASSDKQLDDKVVALNVVVFGIHYHPDIVSKNIQDLFVIDEGVEYEVYGVEPTGRKKYIKLKTQKRE